MRWFLKLVGTALFAVLAACSATTGAHFVENDDCADISRDLLPSSTASLEFADGSTQSVDVEVASTPASQGQGLMCRSPVDAGAGMLFVFESPRSLPFWMFNTYVDLDIVYISADGTIADIKRMTSCTRDGETRDAWVSRCGAESADYTPAGEYIATLELPAGWLDSATPGAGALKRVTWQPET